MKARFPDRKELAAIISDETKRNPQTVMPPFRRNLILTIRKSRPSSIFSTPNKRGHAHMREANE